MGIPETLKRLGPLVREGNLWDEARGRVVGFDLHVLSNLVYSSTSTLLPNTEVQRDAKMVYFEVVNNAGTVSRYVCLSVCAPAPMFLVNNACSYSACSYFTYITSQSMALLPPRLPKCLLPAIRPPRRILPTASAPTAPAPTTHACSYDSSHASSSYQLELRLHLFWNCFALCPVTYSRKTENLENPKS